MTRGNGRKVLNMKVEGKGKDGRKGEGAVSSSLIVATCLLVSGRLHGS